MLIDLSRLVLKYSVALSRRTFAADVIASGYATATSTDDTIYGYVVPVNGRNIQQLPEGCRESSTHIMYTASAVVTLSEQSPQRRANQIQFEGFWHMCIGAADHSQQGGFSIIALQRLGTVP